MNIATLLNQINAKEIVLPAIQRDFVWPPIKIAKLMDSIMRGYPIGIVLMWETHSEIQYRHFEASHNPNHRPNFYENGDLKRLKVVLDGQQRLQSLYLALYGQYQHGTLFFDVLSGRHADDFEEDKYDFRFLTLPDAEEHISRSRAESTSAGGADEDVDRSFFVSVRELFGWSVNEKQKFRKKVVSDLDLPDDDQLRLETNIAKLDEVLTKDQNILKASTIDENKAPGSTDRQTESDILEIFVRINRQGTPLSRSDLIFSMLKLSWKESAVALPEFVDSINEGNSFEITIDFVIRCLYAVSDLGTKFDIDLLRKKSNMARMQASFGKCCEAIRATIDNVQHYCWISSSKILGGDVNLIPFVYYLFHSEDCDLPNSQVENFRKSLFLLAFSSPFSRYADSRLGKFIREQLQPRVRAGNSEFPFRSLVHWVNYWEGVGSWGGHLLQKNPRLAMHLIQGQSGGKVHHALNGREMDHIFPRSELRLKNYDEMEINNFANLWILPKGKNINKRSRHPKEYFSDVSDKVLTDAMIDREMLDYRKYRRFLRERSVKILAGIEKRTGVSEGDFNSAQ